MAVRVTQHNGRAGKHGVYLAKHNDRQFDVSQASHIDAEKSAQNVYWSYYEGMSFTDCERKYYEERFSQALNLQNAKYAKRRQYVYMRTMDEYIANEDTCPEETVIYIGNKDEHVGIDLLKKITTEQIEWERKTYPNVVVLDVALHVDEEGAPHYHKRQVWEAVDKNGNMIVSQTKALKAMGIGLSKKGTRYDNAKQEYTAQCREHFENLCRQYGVEINTERLHKSKTGLEMDDYKASQAQERLKKAEQRAEVAFKQIEALEDDLQRARDAKMQAEAKTAEVEKKLEKLQDHLLCAEPQGYILKNTRTGHCLDVLSNTPENRGFFGAKGTYTINKDEFEYIYSTIEDLEYTTREMHYLKKEKEKEKEKYEELLKQKKDVEAQLDYYRDIRNTIGAKNWDKVQQTAIEIKKRNAQIEARKAEIRAEVRREYLAEHGNTGKSSSNVIGD